MVVGPTDDADERHVRSFYRVAKTYPSTDVDYRTQRDFRGDPPSGLTDEQLWSWDAYSAFGSEAGARRQGRRYPRLGTHIVRYDIPAASGIEWRKTFGPGHYDLKGDKAALHRYLADFDVEV